MLFSRGRLVAADAGSPAADMTSADRRASAAIRATLPAPKVREHMPSTAIP
jgi:hypothetical protein